ncbi:CDP-glycerol glycerophosphotransferase family protein [Actinomyces qiguomingii]|uniref:CDP-glycerol glycerophosphotransferase family protein n=1 Tax=Actinomyces qiguomingii TaxID=2057800 RepID=UPI000CA0149F|nr:CDP-glycerol glycerophosphotransferase family protein [Actinomyces qiguomingii]
MKSEILNKIGIVEERLGMTAQAVSTHRAAGKGTPNKSYARAIRILVEQERYEEAISVAEEWTDAAPESGAAWNRLGFLMHRMKRYEDAIAAYTRSIAAGGETKEQAVYRRGQCRFAIRDDDSGRADMWEVAEVPEFSEKAIQYLYENLAHRGGNLADLRKCLYVAVRLFPKSQKYRWKLAELESSLSNWVRAAEILQGLVDDNVAGYRARFLLGSCYEKIGRLADADATYQSAVKYVKPENKKYGLGSVFVSERRWDAAARALRAEVEKKPALARDAEFLYQLGIALENCFLWSEASRAYAMSVQIAPKRQYTTFRLAACLERRQDFRAAYDTYLAAATVGRRDNSHGMFHAARMALMQNNREAAVACFLACAERKKWPEVDLDNKSSSTYRPAIPDDMIRGASSSCRPSALVAEERRSVIRELLSRGDFEQALTVAEYQFAAGENLDPEDAWILGWLLLKSRADVDRAILVFSRMHPSVTPYVDAARYSNDTFKRFLQGYVEDMQTLPIDDKTILYEVGHGSSISCNPRAIFHAALSSERTRNFTHVWVVNDDTNLPADVLGLRNVVLVRRETPLYFRYLATAKYLVNNTSFGSYFIRRDGQKYLNTWHGTPLKAMGKAISNEFLGYGNIARNMLQCTELAVGNQWTADVLLKEDDVERIFPGRIVLDGTPRIDNIFKDEGAQADVSAVITDGTQRPLLAYVPTWRGQINAGGEIEFDPIVEIEALEAFERAGYQVVYSAHRFVRELAKGTALERFMVPLDVDLYDLLAVADVLVTDYSSVYFDYLVRDRPIVFYCYDLESYTSERGMYDVPMPGPVHTTLEDTVGSLARILEGEDDWQDARRSASLAFVNREDGHASERLLETLLAPSTQIPERRRGRTMVLRASCIPNGITASLRSLCAAFIEENGPGSATVLVDRSSLTTESSRADQLRIFPDGVSVLPRSGGLTLTPVEQYVNQLEFDGWVRLVEEQVSVVRGAYAREFRRMFGGARFDASIDFDGYSRFWARIMAGAPEGTRTGIFLHSEMDAERREKHVELSRVTRLYDDFDVAVSVSESAERANCEAFPALRVGSRSISVNNLVDAHRIDGLAREALPEKLVDFLTGHDGYVVAVGRLSPEKGYDRLIRGFARVECRNNLGLVIVGDGPSRAVVENEIHGAGLNGDVLMLGFLENPYPVIARSAGLCLFSRWEGQGIALLEGMYLRVPVAATDIPGPRSIIEAFGGLLVPSTDAGVAEGVRALVSREVEPSAIDVHAYNGEAFRKFREAFFPGVS